MEKQRTELKTTADIHIKKLFEEIEELRPMLSLVGIEFGVSPDKASFYVRSGADSFSSGMRNLALRGAADAFSFNMEFNMVGDVTKSPACPIATGMFLDKTIKMILSAVKEALEAHESIDKIMGDSAFPEGARDN